MNSKTLAKNLIIILLKLCIALFLFITLNLIFIPKCVNENKDGRITAEYYAEKTKHNVIFVGSSTVHAGISPIFLYEKYGITSYDRSNASQTVKLSYYMIKDMLEHETPELIVFDVGFLRNDSNYLEEPSNRKAVDYMEYSLTRMKCVKDIMGDDENLIDYVAPIFRYHSRWNDLSTDDFKYAFKKPLVTYNGFLMNFESLDKSLVVDDYFRLYANEQPGKLICDENMEYLGKITSLCKERGVDLLLIKMPIILSNWEESYEIQMNEFAAANGLQYINFSNEFNNIGFEVLDDFYDGQHMNVYGAEIFTDYLGQYICSNYNLTENINDSKARKIWENKVDRYNKAKEGNI